MTAYLAEEVRAFDFQGECLVEVFFGHVFKVLHGQDTCVCDEYINFVESSQRLLNERLDASCGANICPDCDGILATNSLDHLLS